MVGAAGVVSSELTAASDGMTTFELISLAVTGLIAGTGFVTAIAALRSSTNIKRSLDIQTAAAQEDEMVDRVARRVEDRFGPRRWRRGGS